LKEQLNNVNDFHLHMKVTPRHDWPTEQSGEMLDVAGDVEACSMVAYQRYQETKDVRWLRASLIVEEASEIMRALANCDKVETLDGLADLLYVTFGTALVFELPVCEAFDAVHQSNMTKRPSDQRCSDKTGFVPPDLKRLL
jgi:predicted HAD superfamily Cof-like phosphohydrolase